MSEHEQKKTDLTSEAPSEFAGRFGFIIVQIFNLLTLVPWLIGVVVMTMALYGFNASADPGEPAYDIIPEALAIAIWWYPILPITTFIGAIMLFRRGKTRQAMFLSAIPIVLTVIATCAVFGFIILAFP